MAGFINFKLSRSCFSISWVLSLVPCSIYLKIVQCISDYLIVIISVYKFVSSLSMSFDWFSIKLFHKILVWDSFYVASSFQIYNCWSISSSFLIFIRMVWTLCILLNIYLSVKIESNSKLLHFRSSSIYPSEIGFFYEISFEFWRHEEIWQSKDCSAKKTYSFDVLALLLKYWPNEKLTRFAKFRFEDLKTTLISVFSFKLGANGKISSFSYESWSRP